MIKNLLNDILISSVLTLIVYLINSLIFNI